MICLIHITIVSSVETFENDISSKLSELNDCFSKFGVKHKMVSFILSISRHCKRLLPKRITQLKRNNLSNTQHSKRETININPVPSVNAEAISVPRAVIYRNTSCA